MMSFFRILLASSVVPKVGDFESRGREKTVHVGVVFMQNYLSRWM